MNDYLLTQVKAGKYFKSGVFLDDNYILLSAETPVTTDLLERLKRWEYNHLYSNSEMTDHPGSGSEAVIQGEEAEAGSLNNQFRDTEELAQAEKEFRSMVEFTEKIFTQLVTRDDLPHGTISNRVKEFIDTIKKSKQYLLRYNEFNVKNNYLVTHAVISTIIGTILGQEFRLPPFKLIELGTTCLLHDVGMIKLPTQLYMSDKILNEHERKAIFAHPALGFKILRRHDYPLAVCLGVLGSHENIDGSGYPRNLTGERISQHSKIISVCSSYAAMNSDRPFRMALDGHHAVLELLKNRNTRYDEAVLRGLVQALSVYPIGTFVKIKNGSKGMVVHTFQEKPRNPLVKLVLGPNNAPLAEATVVNTTSDAFSIVGVLTPNKANQLRKTTR